MEIAVIVILACSCLWLAWRLKRQTRGIVSLSTALESDQVPTRESLHPASRDGKLARLGRVAYDSMAEADLQRAEADGRRKILEHVLNQIEDALLIVDQGQEIFFANAAAAQLWPGDHEGIESLQGRPLIEVSFDHRLTETVALALQTDSRLQERIQLSNPWRVLLVEAEPLDPTLKIGAGAWLLLRDITPELQTEQMRRDFVANASHELRTPLSIIKGHLEMLADEYDDPAIQLVSRHTDRLSRLVDDMLTISKLESNEAGERMLSEEPFDLGDCVLAVIDQLQPLIEKYKSRIEIDLPEKPFREFLGDRFYFDQILFNLVENSLKQNQREGLVIKIRMSRNESTGRLTLEVIDNGIGIPAADLSAVFNRFYRVEKHHSSSVKGTGLGLSIVKRAVEAHRGKISVTSQPGRRTCFSISLPAPPVEIGNGVGKA